jgi:hypothetical protein
MYIFFSSNGMTITLLFIFFKKKQKNPSPKKIFCFCFRGQNSRYNIVTKKYPDYFFTINFAMTNISHGKDISTPNYKLNQFC